MRALCLHRSLVAITLTLTLTACAQGADTRMRTPGRDAAADGFAPDTGAARPDAGPGADAGPTSDLGPRLDAGPALDGGSSFDAGSVIDAGRDAGPTSDAGFDAGRDAGFDAGRDAGFDAGFDAGRDAGRDAGFDAGSFDPCLGVDCSPFASACTDAACNPATGICTLTPRAVGLACDDGNPCTSPDTCRSSGLCVGDLVSPVCGDGRCGCTETIASCAADCAPTSSLPSNACTNGAQSRDGCGSARIIGRTGASSGWTSGVQNTCTANDRHDDACPSFDVGNDHTYALYVKAGERVTADLTTTTTRCGALEEFRSYLKFKFNPDASSTGARSCPTFSTCAAGPTRTDTYATSRTYDATADGWLFVIVDGGAPVYDEHRGYYNLAVSLSRCEAASCGC